MSKSPLFNDEMPERQPSTRQKTSGVCARQEAAKGEALCKDRIGGREKTPDSSHSEFLSEGFDKALHFAGRDNAPAA
jgi:hypothetical protein